jgi:hypothetical protein
MSPLITILIALALAVSACAVLPRRRGAFANSVGTHAGHITRNADVVIGRRHLLLAVGSDAAHVTLCGSGGKALGVAMDEAAAVDDPVDMALLGCASSTLLMVASEAINAGELIFPASDGKVQNAPMGGVHYCVGIALSSAAQDGLVEVDPCVANLVNLSE